MIDIPNLLKTKPLEEIMEIAKNIIDKDTRNLLLGAAFLKYKRYEYSYEFLKHVKDKYPRLFIYPAFYLAKYREVINTLKDSDDIMELVILIISSLYCDDVNRARAHLNKALKMDRAKTLELLANYFSKLPKSPYKDALLIYISKLMKRRY